MVQTFRFVSIWTDCEICTKRKFRYRNATKLFWNQSPLLLERTSYRSSRATWRIRFIEKGMENAKLDLDMVAAMNWCSDGNFVNQLLPVSSFRTRFRIFALWKAKRVIKSFEVNEKRKWSVTKLITLVVLGRCERKRFFVLPRLLPRLLTPQQCSEINDKTLIFTFHNWCTTSFEHLYIQIVNIKTNVE